MAPKTDVRPEDPQFAAMKALTLACDLSAGAKLIAGILVEHLNRQNLLSYPSLESLSALSGMRRGSVVRILGELCDEEGGSDASKLFERRRGRGRSNNTVYLLRMSAFDAILNGYYSRKRARTKQRAKRSIDDAGAAKVPAEIDSQGGLIAVNERDSSQYSKRTPAGAKNRLLGESRTLSRNPYNEPIIGADNSQLDFSTRARDENRLAKTMKAGAALEDVDGRLIRLVEAIPDADLRRRITWISVEHWKEAVSSEMHSAGSGLRILIERSGGVYAG